MIVPRYTGGSVGLGRRSTLASDPPRNAKLNKARLYHGLLWGWHASRRALDFQPGTGRRTLSSAWERLALVLNYRVLAAVQYLSVLKSAF